MIPAGIETKNQQYGTIDNVCCPNCGKTTSFYKIKTVTIGTVIFIPVAKTTNAAFVVCSDCKSSFEINKKEFSHINTNQEVLLAIQNFQNAARERARNTREKYSVGFSSKNQTVAVILSIFFTTFGAPFFYIGKPLYGILCFFISILSCLLGIFPISFVLVYGGFVYAALLGSGKIKDSEGKYLASKKQQLLFTQNDNDN